MQFEIGNQPYLRFAGINEDVIHEDIVVRFAEEINVGIETKLFENNPDPLPILANEDINKILGMGRCELNLAQKIAEFYALSTDYQLSINQEKLEPINLLFPDMEIRYNGRSFR